MLEKSDYVGFMKQALINDAEMLNQIEAFIAAHSLGPSTFGRASIGDARLVDDLRKGGRSLTLRTANRIATFMNEYSKVQ